MASELYIQGSLSYLDSVGVKQDCGVPSKAVDISQKRLSPRLMSVATSETTIDLGTITSLGFAIFINRDPTNYIEIKTATSGTIIAKLLAGECFGPWRIGSGITAPVAIANTAACQMEYMIVGT